TGVLDWLLGINVNRSLARPIYATTPRSKPRTTRRLRPTDQHLVWMRFTPNLRLEKPEPPQARPRMNTWQALRFRYVPSSAGSGPARPRR
ncbi:MAG: hypothetical protein VB135_03215, partial [Burkholderia sp.]